MYANQIGEKNSKLIIDFILNQLWSLGRQTTQVISAIENYFLFMLFWYLGGFWDGFKSLEVELFLLDEPTIHLLLSKEPEIVFLALDVAVEDKFTLGGIPRHLQHINVQ